MTGAPKLRSMRLLRGLEARRRGVYSGTLGYISLNRCLDFNVIIRSIVCTPQQCSIGAGHDYFSVIIFFTSKAHRRDCCLALLHRSVVDT